MRRPQGKGLKLAQKHIACCLLELDSMLKLGEFLRSNNSYGIKINGSENETTASGCQPIGFDPTLNSRLSAPTPPRAIKLMSWKKVRLHNFCELSWSLEIIKSWNFYGLEYEEVKDLKIFSCSHQAIEYFQKLLHDLEVVCSYSLDSVLEAVLHFVVDFQKLHPDLVARSFLQVGYEMSSRGHIFI